MTRYDLSSMLPLERSYLRSALDEAGITHQIVDMVLSVDDEDEAVADQVLIATEEFGSGLRSTLERDDRARSGDTGAVCCERCGNSPAAPINLRRMVGLVIFSQVINYSATLCDTCAESVTRDVQTQTAVKGWTSVVSAAMNPFVIANNASNRNRHRQMLRGKD